MISFDFEYYKPTALSEAVQLFQQLDAQGKQPLYYAGGTEIISMARLHHLYTGAVIDIKGIPETHVYQFHQDHLVIGANVTLTQLAERNLFPLLGETVRHIADFTNRNRITLGGDICGKIIYREAVLPFLLADSLVVTSGPSGNRHVPIRQIFNGELQLEKGEFLVQLLTDRRLVELPFVTLKKTKLEEIDYPLVRVAALKMGNRIRVAFSGVSAIPFRSLQVEALLNDATLPLASRIEEVIRQWPLSILDDMLGSAAYRAFVLRNTLFDVWAALEGVGV